MRPTPALSAPDLELLGDFDTPDLPPVYLSAVCIAKNEGPYVREWIEYHRLVGVERFYFHDNQSEDNTRELLEPYINDGSVVYRHVEGERMQIAVYADAILRYRDQARWMAVMDLDEFIVPNQKDTISGFLKDFEQYAAVAADWVQFDSNGHETRPLENGALVSANFTRVAKNHNDPQKGIKMVKSIVSPKDVQGIATPHFAIYREGTTAVSENFEPVVGGRTPTHSCAKIQVNHYYCKSREEFYKKIERGRAFSKGRLAWTEGNLNFKETEHDYAIQRFVPGLKQAMGIGG